MSDIPNTRHLLRAKDLVDARYSDADLDVAQMAEAAGYSKAHFSRVFAQAFGETPRSYLLTRRLERAAALLHSTDWPVSEICWAVGLTSVGSFSTSFRRMFGSTPTAWREAGPMPGSLPLVPLCVRKLYGRPARRTFREAP